MPCLFKSNPERDQSRRERTTSRPRRQQAFVVKSRRHDSRSCEWQRSGSNAKPPLADSPDLKKDGVSVGFGTSRRSRPLGDNAVSLEDSDDPALAADKEAKLLDREAPAPCRQGIAQRGDGKEEAACRQVNVASRCLAVDTRVLEFQLEPLLRKFACHRPANLCVYGRALLSRTLSLMMMMSLMGNTHSDKQMHAA